MSSTRRAEHVEHVWMAVAFLLPFTLLAVERNLQFPIIINPDGVNYAILAEEYSKGSFRRAINGYWGPALSWLMAVPIRFGADPLVSYRVITVLVLYASLSVVWVFAKRNAFRPEFAFLTLWTTALMMLAWSVDVMTPDLLMLLVMLLFFYEFFQLGCDLHRRRVVLLGTLGGIGFLVKPFGLMFFLAANSILFAYLWARHREQISLGRLARSYLLGTAIFLCFAIMWIAAMSWKYGHLTTGSSGQRNLTLMAPPQFASPDTPPASSFGTPPFPGAVEGLDPTLSQVPTWNPVASVDDFSHFIHNIVDNFESVLRIYWPMLAVLCLVAFPALVALLLSRHPVPELPVRAVLFAAIYVGLYCLVLVETRYLWPAVMVLCLAGVTLANVASRLRPGYRWLFPLLVLPLAFVMVVGPQWRPTAGIGSETVHHLYDQMYAPNAFWRAAGREGHIAAERLGSDYVGKRIASNEARWQSLYISYFSDSEYYGEVKEGEDPEITQGRLAQYDIEVFLYWAEPAASKPTYLADYSLTEELFDGWLKVYSRDPMA